MPSANILFTIGGKNKGFLRSVFRKPFVQTKGLIGVNNYVFSGNDEVNAYSIGKAWFDDIAVTQG